MTLANRSLVTIDDLSSGEMGVLFSLADEMTDSMNEQFGLCRDKIMASLFFEPSTRTRLSFEAAMLVSLGNIYQGFAPAGMVRAADFGYWLYPLTLGGAVFIIYAIVRLVKSYLTSGNPEHRNRTAYLLVGIGLLAVIGIIWVVTPSLRYPVAHIGLMCNTLLITYVVLRHRLLDMKLVVKKGLVYSTIAVLIGASFLILLFSLDYMLQAWSASVGLALTIGVVIALAGLFNPLRLSLEKVTDRLFYGKTYDYRQMVYGFVNKMSRVIELEELAEAMLRPLVNAVRASQASLLFPRNGHFSTKFAERLVDGESVTPIDLRKDGPVVSWLMKEARPLPRETIEIETEFEGIGQEERDALDAAKIEVLCPVRSKQKLVAILALSKKYPRGCYHRDDLDMLMTIANEAGVAMENAALYARAKERANTDELTGLFNHRYFHQRIDEEISRSSRFGDVFSLVLLDIDLFKTYNDASGHLAGDEILKQIGQCIKESVRDTDICFRYGGDEFAVILPKASVEDSHKAAERIRKGIESQMDYQGFPLTCSLGVATWPTDGVMREELIQTSDVALYYAKRTGRNHTCLACEVKLSEVLRVETALDPDNSGAVLNTIYALAATVDAKDHYTYGHSKKVSNYATDIAEAFGYSKEDIKRIRVAALLHDIGKIGVSDQVLQKSEALTPEEWELIRTHPDLGVSIIRHIDSLKGCLAAIQYHHERYDGTGYPAGLEGSNIPLDARILAVADAYDAMISERPYREKSLTHEQALEQLKQCAGTQFDPKVVKVFAGLNKPSSRAAMKAGKGLAEELLPVK